MQMTNKVIKSRAAINSALKFLRCRKQEPICAPSSDRLSPTRLSAAIKDNAEMRVYVKGPLKCPTAEIRSHRDGQ